MTYEKQGRAPARKGRLDAAWQPQRRERTTLLCEIVVQCIRVVAIVWSLLLALMALAFTGGSAFPELQYEISLTAFRTLAIVCALLALAYIFGQWKNVRRSLPRLRMLLRWQGVIGATVAFTVAALFFEDDFGIYLLVYGFLMLGALALYAILEAVLLVLNRRYAAHDAAAADHKRAQERAELLGEIARIVRGNAMSPPAPELTGPWPAPGVRPRIQPTEWRT